MAHLIDKDALVAEIERRRDLHYKYYTKHGVGSIAEYKYDEDREILSFIDTLEVKEVDLEMEPASEDLEEASRNYADNEEYGDDVYYSIKATFKAGAQWQKEQMMKGAVDGEVNIWGSHISLPRVLPSEFSKQRVKVIIIKE